MLTPKQEQFCKNIVLDNMNYSEAYRNAYEASGMSDKTIHEKASILKDRDKIRARIEELRGELDAPRIMSATRRAERLSALAEHADPGVSMKAIDLLNKMTGEYVQKVDASLGGDVHISVELTDD